MSFYDNTNNGAIYNEKLNDYNIILDNFGKILLYIFNNDIIKNLTTIEDVVIEYNGMISKLMKYMITFRSNDLDVKRDNEIIYNNLNILLKNVRNITEGNYKFLEDFKVDEILANYLINKIDEYSKLEIDYPIFELRQEYDKIISSIGRIIVDYEKGNIVILKNFNTRLIQFLGNLNYTSGEIKDSKNLKILEQMGMNILKIAVRLHEMYNSKHSTRA